MAAGKKAKMALSGGSQIPNVHFCPEHDEQGKIVMIMPGRKIAFDCPQGHRLDKNQMVVKQKETVSKPRG